MAKDLVQTALDFDVLVVGGGHAGAEAALAAARAGARTAMVVLDPAAIGRMSCNPAIGGLAKGQLVREVDALGGEMGLCADEAGIQFRMLNTRKGPAVRSPRAQCDRVVYNESMAARVQRQPGLEIVRGEAIGLLVDDSKGRRVARGVVLADGSSVSCRAVVLTTGTFLGGKLFAGEWEEDGGRLGERGASAMSRALLGLGLRLGRHKTGTPPRLRRDSIDFERLEVQEGDPEPVPFSFRTERLPVADTGQDVCWLTRTNPRTHSIIAANAERSPLFAGRIVGTGPRYCPSVEDKVVRFADKDSHLVFLEPETRGGDDIYPNGLSTSLPPEVQLDFLRTVEGLEEVEILRQGYAVEYDHLETDQLRADLHVADVRGLFAAGQINGTSGYEEAAAQGLVAGINAVRFARGEEPFVLRRSDAYIGVLIDDLCRVNPREPYRMFTSRAEFRLLLRSDNADRRLAKIGRDLGILPQQAVASAEDKQERVQAAGDLLRRSRRDGKTFEEILRRPEVSVADVLGEPELAALQLTPDEAAGLEADVKYAGYIARQLVEVERLERMEDRRIPAGFDFGRIDGLSNEARQILSTRRPLTVGEASRLPGVRPADVNLLLVHQGKG